MKKKTLCTELHNFFYLNKTVFVFLIASKLKDKLRTMYKIKISKTYYEPCVLSYTQLIYEFVPQNNTLHIKNKF